MLREAVVDFYADRKLHHCAAAWKNCVCTFQTQLGADMPGSDVSCVIQVAACTIWASCSCSK